MLALGDSSGSVSLLAVDALGLQMYTTWLYPLYDMGSGELRSGLHTCEVSAFSTEPSPSSTISFNPLVLTPYMLGLQA